MKDSGIEWIGEIPEGWEVIPIKYLARYNYDTLTESCSPDFEFNYIDIGSVTYGKGITTFQKFKFKDSPSRARRVVTPGDILISTVRTYLRAIACVNKSSIPQIASTGFLVLQADISKIHPHFLMYSVLSDNFICKVEANSVGISYPAINASQIVHFKLPIPQLSEQFLLVTYLDRQCSEIDALLSKTLSSIEEYKKLKQAVITQAVTKGVRCEREMKDSGVEWIGEIPKEWSVAKAKYCVTITHGSDPKTEGSIPVYGSGSESFKTCGEYKEGPTVLIGRKGATLHIPHYIEGKYWNVDTSFDVKAKNNFSLPYYYYLATSFDYKFYISQTTLPGMTQSNYYNMFLPFPTFPEQEEIVAYLDAKCAEIDGLIAKKEQLVKELESYKKSLIYEVVTGKREV